MSQPVFVKPTGAYLVENMKAMKAILHFSLVRKAGFPTCHVGELLL